MKIRHLAVLLLMLLILTGCNVQESADSDAVQSDDSYKFVIGISPLTTQHEYYVGYIEGIQNAAHDYGVEVIVVDSKWDRTETGKRYTYLY